MQGVDEEQVRSRLAGCLLGGNRAWEKVETTARISQGATIGRKIAMTAPASTSKMADPVSQFRGIDVEHCHDIDALLELRIAPGQKIAMIP